MKTILNEFEENMAEENEETIRLKTLRRMHVQEELIKLSSREEAVIEEETFRFLNIQRRQEKLAQRRGLPPPPEPGHITYAVYS